MAEKKSTKKTTKTKETEKEIIFRANKPLGKKEFSLLSDLVKEEEKKTGAKIILMPYSCEVGE